MSYIIEFLVWLGRCFGWLFSTFDRVFSILLLIVAIAFMILIKPLLDVIRRESRDDEIYEDWMDVRDALRLQGAVARRKLGLYKKGKKG